MQNVFAILIALVVFTATVVFVNTQLVVSDGVLSFDIREAADVLAAKISLLIDGNFAENGFQVPYAGALALGGAALTVPAVFVFTLLGRTGR